MKTMEIFENKSYYTAPYRQNLYLHPLLIAAAAGAMTSTS